MIKTNRYILRGFLVNLIALLVFGIIGCNVAESDFKVYGGLADGNKTSEIKNNRNTIRPNDDIEQINSKRRELVSSLARPSRLMIGLGGANPDMVIQQKIHPDITDVYLTGLGPNNSWRSWNKPDGEYLRMRLKEAEKIGAIPMFTVYQIAAAGDGNISVLSDLSFMRAYWEDIRKMFEILQKYDKPVLLNIEPDFWGYTHRANPNPDSHFSYVGTAIGECNNLGNTVKAMAGCIIQMARKYTPKVKIGFPPSGFLDNQANEVAYMRKLGVDLADFAIIQTGDRDAGCYEAAVPPCDAERDSVFKYWDETNARSPNFNEHFAYAEEYSRGIQLPILWWQVSIGVPSESPGGIPMFYRDNKVKYFFLNTRQIIQSGGFGVVFGIGMDTQTQITSDGGQFKRMSSAYLSNPEYLP